MNNNCEKFERLISDRLDNELVLSDEQILNEHLSICEACRNFEASAGYYSNKLRSLPDAAAEETKIVATVKSNATNKFWLRRVSIPIPIAAGLAVLMSAGWLVALRPDSKPTATTPAQPVLMQSVEIIRVQPVNSFKIDYEHNDTIYNEEDHI